MHNDVRITRANARSFAQISLDRTLASDLGQELFDVRRISRIFRPVAKSIAAGIDIADIRNLRRVNGEIIILVRNAAQFAKLRQVLPRLQALVEQASLRDKVKLRILPAAPEVQLRRNTAIGAPRVASAESIEAIRKKAGSMKPSALKDALASLAETLAKARGPAS